jgi:hypothetical protein
LLQLVHIVRVHFITMSVSFFYRICISI